MSNITDVRSLDGTSPNQLVAALLPLLEISERNNISSVSIPGGGAAPVVLFGRNIALKAPGVGQQNGRGNETTIQHRTIGNALGVDDAPGIFVSPGTVAKLAAVAPGVCSAAAAGFFPSVGNHAAAGSGPVAGETLTISIEDTGYTDGNDNRTSIGSGNTGNSDGNSNRVAIGSADGLSISVAPIVGSPLSGIAVVAGIGPNVTYVGPGGLARFLAASGFATEPAGQEANSLPKLNLVFESIQITVTDTGNNDGNGNTIGIGSGDSGSYDGNASDIAIGNSDGVSISALNPRGVDLISENVQLNAVGGGDGDGNGNRIALGDWNSTSGNGNSNSLLIGNDDGISVSVGAALSSPGSQDIIPSVGTSTLTDLGSYSLQGLAASLNVAFGASNLSVAGAGNDYNGSFDGNNNTVAIGNDNGASVDLPLGEFYPKSGPNFVAESVLIQTLNSGQNDGSANNVVIDSDNGADAPGSKLSGFLSSNAAATANAGANTAGIGPGEPPSWSDVSVTSILDDIIAMMSHGAGSGNVIFESVGISVVNSGNNDGSQNRVLIGSQDGGGHNGNDNIVAIGNDNGVLIQV